MVDPDLADRQLNLAGLIEPPAREPDASGQPDAAVPADVMERIRSLREQITHHNQLYYDLDENEISDEAYDALVRELRGLEAEWPQSLERTSPTQRIGINEPVNGNRNVISNNICLNNTSAQITTTGAQTVVDGTNITA